MNVLERFSVDNNKLADYSVEVESVAQILVELYRRNGTLLLCGNGGSASDCEHIVGELLKDFRACRKLSDEDKNRFSLSDVELADKLRYGVKAISLVSQTSILTALANDVGYDYAFAQCVQVYGGPRDVLFALSTGGNSLSVINAVKTAKAKGMKVVGFTGHGGGEMAALCDEVFKFPSTQTFKIQEYTLPVYHAICARFEEIVWGLEK